MNKKREGEIILVLIALGVGWAVNEWIIVPDLGKQLGHLFWFLAFALTWHYNATKEAVKEQADRVLEALDRLREPSSFERGLD